MNKIVFVIIMVIVFAFAINGFAEPAATSEGIGWDKELKILSAIVTLTILALAFGLLLGFAHQKLAVQRDEKVQAIEEVLPNANCGACGLAGCRAYAESIVYNNENITLCSPGGNAVAHKIADIMGMEVEDKEKQVARIHCRGENALTKKKFYYNGILDCNQANSMFDGEKACPYGCLGLGSCVRACAFDAIFINDRGIAEVDEEKCTGCGNCVPVCPKGIITLMPLKTQVYVTCSSHGKAKEIKSYCIVGCTGCKRCVKACNYDAIHVENFLARIDTEKCTNCGDCIQTCPQDAIVGIGEAEKYMKQLETVSA